MTATRLDITIEQGADYGTPFTIASPANLTGFGAVMQIKLAAGYPNAILSLSSSTGELVIDTVANTVTPVIPASVTSAINAGRYAYDLKLVAPSGTAYRAYQGDAYVSAEVTDFVFVPVFGFLLENGDYLLLENGNRILLEDIVIPDAILLENGGYLLNETNGQILLEA